MNSYAGPFGIARPFSAGGSFPGAPAFGGPASVGSLGPLSFPVTDGPGGMAGSVGAGVGSAAPLQRANRVQDWGTNGQVAYHVVCMPDRNEKQDNKSIARLKELGLGMLCFARDMKLDAYDHPGDPLAAAGMKPSYNAGANGTGERTAELFELTALNNYLRSPAANGRLVSDIFATAAQVLEAFPMLGVVLTEVAPSNDTDYGQRHHTRVINFVVRGRCQAFNLWSGKRPAGTPVFFIVKKVPVAAGQDRYAWCFVPYPGAGQPDKPCWGGKEYHAAFPPPEELCWHETHRGVTTAHVGAAMRVGIIGDNVGDVALDPQVELYKQGLFKGNNMVMPVTTELFVRI